MQPAERVSEVLDLIVCPACHGRLALATATADCEACGRRYPIVGGIPVLLTERATKPDQPA